VREVSLFDWRAASEAAAFAQMVRRGAMTLAEAEETILMTPEQAAHLKKHSFAAPITIDELFARRRATVELLRKACSEGREVDGASK